MAAPAGEPPTHPGSFSAPIEDRYFEDYVPGAVHACGELAVTEEEIVEFARVYDPQPFHLDAEHAASGPFGGIVASGWHTAALMMRLFAAHYLSAVASLGSPGVDELRWPAPLRPGRTVSLRATVLSARRSRSRPDRGIVQTRAELFDDEGAAVLRVTVVNLLLCRHPQAAAE